jgi:hypothetical protein
MRFLPTKWVVPIVLLAAIYVADQIRINRPDHKYRLTVEVETPDGLRTAAGVLSVRPNRNYGGTGSGSSVPQTSGDALLVELSPGRNLVVLMAYGEDGSNFEDASFLPTRVLGARDRRLAFRDMKTLAGRPPAPVPDTQRPVLIALPDLNDPKSARRADWNDLEASFGKGYRLGSFALDIVASGYWPIDFAGALGDPVTRGIEKKLPWLNTPGGAATALQAAGLKTAADFAPEAAFTRK